MSPVYRKINLSIYGLTVVVVCALGVTHFVYLAVSARSDSYNIVLTLGVMSGVFWLVGSICATGPFYAANYAMQLAGYVGSVLNALGAITTLGVAVLGTLPAIH